MDHQAHYYS